MIILILQYIMLLLKKQKFSNWKTVNMGKSVTSVYGNI
jgi:hypothetical protein